MSDAVGQMLPIGSIAGWPIVPTQPPSNGLSGSPDQSKIIPALVAAQGDMPMIGFDSSNPFFKSRYASLGAVIGGTRPVLSKHGLGIFQKVEVQGPAVRIHSFIFHTSAQWLDGGTMERPLDEESAKNPLQDAGSIITYCKRYAWSAICGVYSDEDQDGNDAPSPPPKSDPAKPGIPTAKTRLWALNKLEAAPGQPHRELVRKFLIHRGWIPDLGEPEGWALEHVTASIAACQKLAAEITQWDTDRHQPAEGVTP